MNVTMTVLLVIAAIVIGSVLVWYGQQRRTHRLRRQFGPEYERARSQVGERRAEADLEAREQRVRKLDIRPLSTAEADRFGEVWRHIQTLFVDDPRGAINEADHLVNEVMTARGYPMGEFEQRAADISVDHPREVEHYRAARTIAERNKANTASTEDLRQAVIYYRALFEDLLEQKPTTERRPAHAPARSPR